MSESYAKLIVNPMSGSRTTARDWPHIREFLRQAGIDFDYEFTRHRGQATEIARAAVDKGCKHLIAVGGDGTVNEIINGIFLSPNHIGTSLGIVFTGTANAFSYSLGITHHTVRGLSYLVDPKQYLIDIGIVQCQKNGQPYTRYFYNEASIGLPSEIVKAWAKLPGKIGKRTSLIMHRALGYGVFVRYRKREMKVQIENHTTTGRRYAVVIANGQYFADGMQIAPYAVIDDGYFEVITVNNISKLELLKMQPALYQGNHLTCPGVQHERAASITVDSGFPLPVEVDGEIIGETPANFSLLPKALTLIV